MRRFVDTTIVLLWTLSLLFQNGEAFQVPQLQTASKSRMESTSTRLGPSRVIYKQRQRQQQQQQTFFSLAATPSMGGVNDSNNESNKKGFRKLFELLKKNPLVSARMTIVRFLTRFKSLSKKAKVVVLLQLVSLSLILGVGTKRFVELRTTGTPTSIVRQRPAEVSYSTFMDLMESNGKGHNPGRNPAIRVDNVVIGKERIGFQLRQDEDMHQRALEDKKLVDNDDVAVRTVKPRNLYTTKVYASPDLVQFLRHNEIPFRAASTKGTSAVVTLTRSVLFLAYFAFLFRMYRAMTGGGGSDTPGKLFGSNRKKALAAAGTDAQPLVKFDDIEGIDSAKFEVMELVDALRNPGKYAILGARAPKGLLLEGPPGTGKTMLARACAATAGVPLFYCSGSDFVEMFVGRGAARVRKTFARAAKLAPCIIFIDELDALGKSRAGDGFGMGMRSNDEAEQTLNQLLACMDGLDSTKGVCVLAATNRRDVLDQALIRPGRFDRIIKVDLPDVKGRERILRVHARKLPGFQEGQGVDDRRLGSLGVGRKVDLSAIASLTNGLSGAELEFIVNEAAIRAVRRVSAKLREDNVDLSTVTPAVEASDFEGSLKSFYETRKPSSGVNVNEMLRNVMKPKIA